jgi:hypothetical protein
MRVGTHYAKVVFLHLVRSTCHVVHSGASGARNVDTLFFILWWAHADPMKSASGHITLNLCFFIRCDLHVV